MQAIAALKLDPVLPVWLLSLLAVLCIVVLAAGVLARARGSVFRAAAFLVILAWLAGPTLVRESRHGLDDIALLVMDRSASMGVGDRAALADAAMRKMQAAARQISGLELRSLTVPEAGHDGTRLWGAARQALANIPADRLAGIIAITDGQVHDLPAAVPDGVPLHVMIPAKGEEWDRRIRVLSAPCYGIVGHSVTLRVVVEDLGVGAPAGPASLTVQRDGEAPVTAQMDIGVPQDIAVQIARAGPSIVQVATPAMPGEASALNNQAVVQINGVRDRLRVLLVSGEPNQGERTWRRLLKSDPAVDLVHFTILRPPEKDDSTPLNELALIAFPTHELFAEKLTGFDLIILDRFADRGILPHVYLRNIADYVRAGGALLLTAGPEFVSPESLDQTPLAEVLPAHAPYGVDGVANGAFRPRVTALGARHPVTQDLPGANVAGAEAGWGSWYRAIGSENVQGQVLMSGLGEAPLLILNRVDKGRVAMLMSDQIWLWSHGHQGGGPQAELLRRVAHWLMKEPELDEERFSARLEGGVLHVDRRSAAGGAAGPVRVTAPDGAVHDMALVGTGPGQANASMAAGLPGVWQASAGDQVAFAVVGQDNPREFADLRATADRVAPLVRESGGGLAWLQAPELRRVGPTQTAAGDGWFGLRHRAAYVVTGVARTPLFPPWFALPLLLGIVVAAWSREASS